MSAATEVSAVQVVLMGLITVFVVLVCLIVIIKLLGLIISAVKKDGNSAPAAVPAPAAPAPAAMPAPSADKQKLVAAIAAVIAEDMGADVSHLKIHSIKKL